MYRKTGKRTFDIVIAATGLIILWPLFVLLAILLSLHYRDNPFFKQQRIGLGGKPFRIFKFRTIHYKTKEDMSEPVISKIGAILRLTSLDELPQLWNVLKGEMSLIGPRPLLCHYLGLYRDQDFVRHAVLPGISGLAQIRGRNSLDWNQKFRYDSWYVKHLSAGLDFYILLKTIGVVLSGSGICSAPTSGAQQFQGFYPNPPGS